MAIVADANALLDRLRRRPRFPAMKAAVEEHFAAGALATNVIVRDEIMYGGRTADDREELRRFLDPIPTRDLTVPAADLAADIRRTLDARGETLGVAGQADIFIAAITITHGDALLTSNRRHFDRMVRFGLRYARP